MALEVEIDTGRRLVQLTASGALTDGDVFRVAEQLRAAKGAIQGFDMLADLSAAERFEVSTGAIRAMSMDAVLTGEASRRAIVAHSLVAYGAGRMYALLRGAAIGNLQVFRTRAEARAWLEAGRSAAGTAM